MNVQLAFYRTVHDFPGGCDGLAAAMGMTPAVLRNKANPNTKTNIPSLADADRAMAVTGTYDILHSLAQNHGHVCFPVGAAEDASDLAVLELVTQVWSANGNLGASVNTVLNANRIRARDLDTVRDAIYRAQCAMLSMLNRLEQMAEPERSEA